MIQRFFRAAGCLLVTALCLPGAQAARVEFTTALGTFEVELFEDEAPQTVANFLNYVRDGDYDGTFLHRSVSGFVLQGGGFRLEQNNAAAIETDAPVVNEFGRSNTRGTLAMAKLGGDPDSATSQWFFNLVDNSDPLDSTNGGFTVFGEVVGNGMAVVDGIVARTTLWNFGSPLQSLPLIDFNGTTAITGDNVVSITVSELPESEGFTINPGVAGSWFNAETAGQGWFVDVFQDDSSGGKGSSAELQLFVAWFTYDNDEPPAEEDLTFGSDQHRWFTSLGTVEGDTVTMDLFRNAGGVFDDPRETVNETVGTLTMRFTGCTSAVLSYAFTTGEGGSGEIEVERLSPDIYCQRVVDGTVAAPAR